MFLEMNMQISKKKLKVIKEKNDTTIQLNELSTTNKYFEQMKLVDSLDLKNYQNIQIK